MTAAVYTVQQFVAEAKSVVDQGKAPQATVEALTPMLQRLVSRPGCLTDLGGLADPDRTFDIHVADNLSVMAIVWPANGGAPAHNHNGWAMVGVVIGHERNIGFKRSDDGSKPWTAKLEQSEVQDIGPGQTGWVVPPDDIHSVSIPQGKTVAVHLFGTNIKRQWRYAFDPQSGEVKPFVFR